MAAALGGRGGGGRTLLADGGADPLAKDKSGRTALDLAESELVGLMVEWGLEQEEAEEHKKKVVNILKEAEKRMQ